MKRGKGMPIVVHLDRVLVDKKVKLVDLSENVDLAYVNLSKIKTGNIKAIRFSTLESICDALDCQPGDLLEFVREEESEIE